MYKNREQPSDVPDRDIEYRDVMIKNQTYTWGYNEQGTYWYSDILYSKGHYGQGRYNIAPGDYWGGVVGWRVEVNCGVGLSE